MRRLKDDFGIVEDRTAERNIEFNTEDWQLAMYRKKTPNKYIDLDTLVITGKGETDNFIIKVKLREVDTPFNRDLVYFDEDASGNFIPQWYSDAGHTIELNRKIGEGNYELLDCIELDDIMNAQFSVLSDIHIYYAYVPYREAMNHDR